MNRYSEKPGGVDRYSGKMGGIDRNSDGRRDGNMTIRPMTEEDLEQVETIERECFSEPWSLDAFRDSLRLPYTLYLVACRASADGAEEIAGYCGMYLSAEEAEIPNVAVKESCRGCGVARQMLTELLSRAKERGVTAVFLEVRAGNIPAQRLYAGLGFTEAGIRRNFYEKPREDAVIMWKK